MNIKHTNTISTTHDRSTSDETQYIIVIGCVCGVGVILCVWGVEGGDWVSVCACKNVCVV